MRTLPLAVLALTPLAAQQPELELTSCTHRASGTELRCGTLRVPENRSEPDRRWIGIHFVVVPARAKVARNDAVFVLAGGPGQAATTLVGRYVDSWMREERDIVLVDQRGTGKSNPLQVELPGSDDDPQGYLEPVFTPAPFRAAVKRLEQRADLTQYTTPIAMDDLDAIRAALDYERINLIGGSYGTRVCLVYLRRHPEHVRTMTLRGVAPIAFKNPLFHARAAQTGFEVLCEECAESYPKLREQLEEILDRLDRKPATVEVSFNGRQRTVQLTRTAFAEALRLLMYTTPTNRQVPRLIAAAHRGDYRPFAETGIQRNRALRRSLALGMLMSVVGSEDLPRIRADEIEAATAGTFLGDGRVRRQLAVAELWPRGEVPENHGDPVTGDAPVLLVSGSHDPVTPPRWGAEAARHLPNSLHVIVPRAHDLRDPCIDELVHQLLEQAAVENIDTSCVAKMRMPRVQKS